MAASKVNKFPPKKPDNSHVVKPVVKHNWSNYQYLYISLVV